MEYIEKMPEHDCFRNSWQYAMDNETPTMRIIHGKAQKYDGTTIDHAWVEDGDTVIDPTVGIKLEKPKYYELFNAQPDNIYTVEQACIKMVRNHHHGPWASSFNWYKTANTIRQDPSWEIVNVSDIPYRDAADGYYYHVTTPENAKDILINGFQIGKKQSMAQGVYRKYSKGKLFFSERTSVRFWADRIEEHLQHESDDDIPELVAIKIPKNNISKILSDDIGTNDSNAQSYYVTENILPSTSAMDDDTINKASSNKWYKISMSYALNEMYHGTSLQNGLDILLNGFREQQNERGIFFTADLEKAARYAVWEERIGGSAADKYIIFKVNISGKKRTNKIKYDPLDRSESAWNEDGDGYDDNRYDIERWGGELVEYIIKNAFKSDISTWKAKDLFSKATKLDYNDLDTLKGYNLYRDLTPYIIDSINPQYRTRQSQDKIFSAIRQFVGGGYENLTEYLEITEDGTLDMTEHYWKTREQIIYNKGYLSPAAIKGVYLPADILQTIESNGYNFNLQKMSISAKMLPHESRSSLEEERRYCGNFRSNVQAIIEYNNTIEDIVGEINSELAGNRGEIGQSLNEIVIRLKNFEFGDNSNLDKKELLNAFEPVMEEADNIHDYVDGEWYKDQELKKIDVIYIDLAGKEDKIALANSIKTAMSNGLSDQITAGTNEQYKNGNWYRTSKIKKMPNGKYRVTDESGKKNLGESDSIEGAKKRLKQVEYFKHKKSDSNRWYKTSQNEINLKYPVAGPEVDGRIVINDIPNISSISSTYNINEYYVLNGIREVSMSYFSGTAKVDNQSKQFAKQLQESNWIKPLIVVDDGHPEGPYILEGSHRWDALKIIGARSFPALVVVVEEKDNKTNNAYNRKQYRKGNRIEKVSFNLRRQKLKEEIKKQMTDEIYNICIETLREAFRRKVENLSSQKLVDKLKIYRLSTDKPENETIMGGAWRLYSTQKIMQGNDKMTEDSAKDDLVEQILSGIYGHNIEDMFKEIEKLDLYDEIWARMGNPFFTLYDKNGNFKRETSSKREILRKKAQNINVPNMFLETIKDITNKCRSIGLKPYAVGGFVRDLIMGKKLPKDLDVMVDIENPQLYKENLQPILNSVSSDPIKFLQQSITGSKIINGVSDIQIIPSKSRDGFYRILANINYLDKSKKTAKQINSQPFETTINPSMLLAIQFNKRVPRGELFGIYAVDTPVGEVEIAYPRTERYEEGSRNPFTDIGSMRDDANRRDFGMNSLYLDLNAFLNKDPNSVLDPTGHGIKDIEDGVIRITDPSAIDVIFNQDPLRVLRCFRFAATLGFSIDPQIIEYIQKHPYLISSKVDTISQDFQPKLSAERIRDELIKILGSNRVPEVLDLMHHLKILQYLIPLPQEALAGWDTEQQPNPYHNQNLWGHTITALKNFRDVISEFPEKDSDEKWMCNFVILLHDIGKSVEKRGFQNKLDENGEITRKTFVGHAEVSGEISKEVLSRLRLPLDQASRIEKMVILHDSLMEPNDKSAIIRDIGILDKDFFSLLKVGMSDRRSHAEGYTDDTPLKKIYADVSENFDFYKLKLSPMVNGKEIMDILGISGKIVGDVSRFIVDLQVDGIMNSKEFGIQILTSARKICDKMGLTEPDFKLTILNNLRKDFVVPDEELIIGWIGRNAQKIVDSSGRSIFQPLLDGNEIMSLGVKPGPMIGKIKSLLLEKQITSEILDKEQAADFVRSFIRSDDPMQDQDLKFSESNMNYRSVTMTRKASVSTDSMADFIATELESGEPNWALIRRLLNDDQHFMELQNFYKEDQQYAAETYRELADEFLMENVADFRNAFYKDAASTEYGDVPQNIQSGSLDYSELASFFGEAADAAIQLVQKYAPGLLQNIQYIGIAKSTDALGVYETDLTKVIQQQENQGGNEQPIENTAFLKEKFYKIAQEIPSSGVAFRLNPQRINQEVSQMISQADAELSSYQGSVPDETLQLWRDLNLSQITQLILGEVIVHEATHAQGYSDEGTPVAAEREFLNTAITEMNNERDLNKIPRLPIQLK